MSRAEEPPATTRVPPPVLLDASTAAALLRGAESGEPLRVSLDLHLGEETVEFDRDAFVAAGTRYALAPLAGIAASRHKVFRPAAADPGAADSTATVTGWEPVSVFTDAHHQLVPTAEAPTAEIDGVQMHITSGPGPFAAASAFAAAVVRPGDRVLDTCGGLGYTAIAAVRRGAAEVISCERSAGVLALRDVNPWSHPAPEESARIRLERADVLRALADVAPESFDTVIHDPPRHALAPELYTGAFYLRLRSALRPGGRLFHYTGAPGRARRGDAFVRRIAASLGEVGFRAEVRRALQGIVARGIVARGIVARGIVARGIVARGIVARNRGTDGARR